MKSWEVLRDAAEKIGVKALAAKLHLSSALVYKWCQQSTRDDPASSGARNPLDRVKAIFDATDDARVVNWLCNAADGFFVSNPRVEPGRAQEQLLSTTQHLVTEFGEMLVAVSRSIHNDNRITPDEADTIRQLWEQLKSNAECFVVACERGMYANIEPRGRD